MHKFISMNILLISLFFVSSCSDTNTSDTSKANPTRSDNSISEMSETDARLLFFASLFTGAEQYENFNRIVELTPTSSLTASSRPYDFPQGSNINLPSSFDYQRKEISTENFLAETDTSAVLVLKNGEIRTESYRLTGGRNVNWLSMSVAKSFISALVGIAVEGGNNELLLIQLHGNDGTLGVICHIFSNTSVEKMTHPFSLVGA